MGAKLQFPDPENQDANWDGTWDAPNSLTYKWINQDRDGRPLTVGHWDVVGTVGRPGPQGPTGKPGANGLHPTVNPETGCWIYNWTDYDPSFGANEQHEETNYPTVGSIRILGYTHIGEIDGLNNDSGWDERKKYNRNDAFMIAGEDTDSDVPVSRLYIIPWHEFVDEDGNVEDSDEAKNAHSFIDMGLLGVSGPQGQKGDTGKQGPKGVSKCQIVNSMPHGEEEGEMFLDKTTNTMFIAVTPV